ncbi:MAG: hypothetical protein N2Z85_02585 [Patescibacteria group bacterium]|nr:hypothetical protein [Patescibacteria group bacterium]
MENKFIKYKKYNKESKQEINENDQNIISKKNLNYSSEKLNYKDSQKQGGLKIKMIAAYLRHGYIDQVLKIKDKFNIPEKIIKYQEIQDAIKERMIELLKKSYIKKVLEIKDKFSMPEEIMKSEEIQSAAKEGVINSLKKGYIDAAVEIKDKFSIPEEIIKSEIIKSKETNSVIKEKIINLINWGSIDMALEIKNKFPVPEKIIKSEEVQSAAKEAIINSLKKGSIYYAIEIKDKFSIPEEIIKSERFQSAALEGIINSLKKGSIDDAIKIKDNFSIPEEIMQSERFQSATKEAMINSLKEGSVYDAIKIKNNFSIPEEIMKSEEVQKIIKARKIFSTDVDQITILEKEQININDLKDQELENMFDFVSKEFNDWKDENSIIKPFKAGAEIFGYRRMLEYIKRKNLTLHDALHAFLDILQLFKISGLSQSEFYGQILYQVKIDDSTYPEGTAHHHLNAIAKTMNKNISEVLEKAREHKEINKLQNLVANFNNPQSVFASWINLKKYSQLEQLLNQKEIFDELKKLKTEGNNKLYNYIETLAFHPDSKINMTKVIQFWREPELFLDTGASHTSIKIHEKIKPSNYLNIPNLDLTATELRDALVEGKIDGLSVFNPLEIRYTISLEDIKHETLPNLINKALGSIKKGIKGEAKNPNKLFSEIQKLLKPYGVSVIEYVQGKPLPENIDLSKEIEELIYNNDFGMKRPSIKTKKFVARINLKSDPEAAIAGNDTASCMDFGDGKNTVYTFNPNTSQFVVRILTDDNKERTIAQSVLTKDIDIKTSAQNVISNLEQGNSYIENILPADILKNAPVYAACDNIEMSPNYIKQYEKIIQIIFRDFFREYMNRYANIQGLNPKKIPIGQGFTKIFLQLPTEANTFLPQAPVSYSDKKGNLVYMLDLEMDTDLNLILEKQVQEIKVERKKDPPLPNIKGLDYLTFEDTIKMAYLEQKAYSDNKSLIEFLFNIENKLIAKDINNTIKERPNMSLKYVDDNNQMCGYILAWEGILSNTSIDIKNNKTEKFLNQPCIYISDIATDQKNLISGGKLIKGFIELYKQNYLDKGNAIPIFAQARESTSYQIIKRQLNNISKEMGYNFELIELPTYTIEKDIMHPIIIQPIIKNK